MKNTFSALSSKIGAFIPAFSSISSPLSAVNPVVIFVINNITDLSSVSGQLSSNIASFSTHLLSPLITNLVNPLKYLGSVCKKMQTYSNFLSSDLSTVSANPALNLILSVLTADLTIPFSSLMTEVGNKISLLTNSLTVLVGLFSLSPTSTHRNLLTISTNLIINHLSDLLLQLKSFSPAIQDYLSTITDVCGSIQRKFTILSISAGPFSSDLETSFSTIATTTGNFSIIASSLGASLSSLLTALSSTTDIAIHSLDVSLLSLSKSALNLSTTLVALNFSLPRYFSSSLSPVLLRFSTKLDQLSITTKSILTLCLEPLTNGLKVLNLVPGADSQLSDVMNSLSSTIIILSNQVQLLSLNNSFIDLTIQSSFPTELVPLYNALASAVNLIQPETIAISNAVHIFETVVLSFPSTSLGTVFQRLVELLIVMVQEIDQVSSFVQSLVSPFSSLSSPVSLCLTSLANISTSALSIAESVNSASKSFSNVSPYTVTLPMLAQNLTQLSMYATSVITVLSSLSSSPDLASIANILSNQFPSLEANFISAANSLESLQTFFTNLNKQLLSTVDNSLAFLSALLHLLSSWFEIDNFADVLNALTSVFKIIANAVRPISNSLNHDFLVAIDYLSDLAATSISIVSLIKKLQIGPIPSGTKSKQYLSFKLYPNRIADCIRSLQQFSASSKQFLDTNVHLLDKLMRPLYRVVSPPLDHLSTALLNIHKTTSLMKNNLSMLLTLSSLITLVANDSAESLYSSFDALSKHLDNIAAKMVLLSSNMQQRTNSVLEVQLREYSNEIRFTSSEIISNSESLLTVAQRLSGLSKNVSLGLEVSILKIQILDLSRTSSQLVEDFRLVISSIRFLTSPLSYFSPAMSSLITDLTNISSHYSFNNTILLFSQHSSLLCTGLSILSVTPLLAVIPELAIRPLLTELSVGLSQMANNVSVLRSLKHLMLTADPEEETVLAKTAKSMTKTAKLLLRVANQLNSSSNATPELQGRVFGLTSILTSVAALFLSTAKSASSLVSLLYKLPSQTRRKLGRINPATGILLGLVEKEIATGSSSMNQDVPGYTFGKQNFEGPVPEDWANFYSTLESECDLPTALDGSTPIAYAAICQKRVAANGADIPGGFQSSSIDSIMGFLQDASKVLTFSANAPMALQWSSAVSGSVAYHAQYDYSADDDMNHHATFDNDILGIDILVETNNKFNIQPSLKVHVGKHMTNQHSNVRTVSVNLGDQDSGMIRNMFAPYLLIHLFSFLGDYFAVRITQDPIYATPIFTTLGGYCNIFFFWKSATY